MKSPQANPPSASSPGLRGAIILCVVCLALLALVVIARCVTTVGDGDTTVGVDLPDMRLDINAATVSELRELPGIGPALAQRIVDHREEHGPWEAIDDLAQVHGIGERTIARIRPYIMLVKRHAQPSREE